MEFFNIYLRYGAEQATTKSAYLAQAVLWHSFRADSADSTAFRAQPRRAEDYRQRHRHIHQGNFRFA